MKKVILLILLSCSIGGCIPLVYLLENRNLPDNYSNYDTVKHDSLISAFHVISLNDLNSKNTEASSIDIITADKRQFMADSIFASNDTLYFYNDSSYAFDMNDIDGIRINHKFNVLKFFIAPCAFAAFGAVLALAPDQNYSAGWFAAAGFAAGLPFAIDDYEYILTGNYQLLE